MSTPLHPPAKCLRVRNAHDMLCNGPFIHLGRPPSFSFFASSIRFQAVERRVSRCPFPSNKKAHPSQRASIKRRRLPALSPALAWPYPPKHCEAHSEPPVQASPAPTCNTRQTNVSPSGDTLALRHSTHLLLSSSSPFSSAWQPATPILRKAKKILKIQYRDSLQTGRIGCVCPLSTAHHV